MNKQFKRILDLAQKTGDRVIVTDPNGDSPFILMALDQYENLLSESSQTTPHVRQETRSETVEVTQDSTPDVWGAMQEAGVEGKTWDLSELSEEEMVDLERQHREFVKKHSQNEAKDDVGIKDAFLEIEKSVEVEDVSDQGENIEDDLGGEEQFYLEPIE